MNTSSKDEPGKPERVSIIVIAYNSAATIRETLNSCYAQSYANFEIIVADDGSSDDTVSIARKLAGEHPTIKTTIAANSTNSGIVKNCKSGLDKASGKWVKIIGADDIMLPTGLAQLVAAGEEAKADVVLSQFRSFGSENRLYPLPWTVRGIRSRNLARSMLMGFGAVAPGALVRLSTLRDESLPSEEYVMAEDTMFYELAKRGFRFAYLEQVTVKYRVHAKQVTVGQSAAANAFRDDQARFRRDEVRGNLGPLHPYYLHLRYQGFIDRNSVRLPWFLSSALRLADPILLTQMYVNRDLPWQRRRRTA
jgi:glycosyltransferase involved in cell wall biosynthesis